MENQAKKILVIDDDTSICDMLTRFFQMENFEVMIAHDGIKGLEFVKNHKPDLIMLDVSMPSMGGISFYHNLASVYDASRQLPVLVMSGQPAFSNVFEGLKIEGFIKKPFDLDELLIRVKKILNKVS
ncbi:MAG: response regulator [Candidatus Omnitrophica bacterium]|nr:response regulator [Candidatus Omnitrophota bacterium]